MPSVLRAVALGLAAIGCAQSDATQVIEPPPLHVPTCPPGEAPVAGGCLPAGMQPNGCPAGEVPIGEGGCRQAGVETCAAGFVADGRGGCEAVLFDGPCPPGLVALPGERSCRALAPCGTGQWGDIVVDADTQHVDGAYTGGGSNGSPQQPWTTIQEAIVAAIPDAVVAIAQGSYAERLSLETKAVRLWGRCPELVTVDSVTLRIAGGELHDLAVTSGGVLAEADARLERVWIHDTTGYGVTALGGAKLTVADSLIEATVDRGIYVEGSEANIVATVIRGTLATPGEQGRGINVRDDLATGARGTATIEGSLVEQSLALAVMVHASDVTMSRSVVRDTLPGLDDRFGRCINIQGDDADTLSVVSIDHSVVERCRDGGIVVSASDATIESTTVRDVLPNLDLGDRGYGITAQKHPDDPGPASRVQLRSSLVDHASEVSLFVGASIVDVEATAILDTQPVATGFGRGISVQNDPDIAQRSVANIRQSRIAGGSEVGVYTQASDLELEGVVISDFMPRPTDGQYGRGMSVQMDAVSGEPSHLEMRWSVLERNHTTGLLIDGSSLLMDTSVIRDTQPVNDLAGDALDANTIAPAMVPASFTVRWSVFERNSTAGVLVAADGRLESTVVRDTFPVQGGLFGDGVVALAYDAAEPHIELVDMLIAHNYRAGVAAFGGSATLSRTTLLCNAISLVRADFDGHTGALEDGSDNACTCNEEALSCKALDSGGLQPPQAPAEPLDSTAD